MNAESKSLRDAVCVGEAARIAPGHEGQLAAFFWKFWVSGSEVYSTNRSMGNMTKISVHKSGQIHMRFEGKDLQHLAPALLLGNGLLLHAFELRFLLSPDAYRPPKETLKGKRAFLIDVPQDTVLIMNLLVGQVGCTVATDLPHELLPAAKPFWLATLRDQRPVVLVARLLKMDKQNRDELEFIRHELNPKANFSKLSARPPYLEIKHVVWDPKGGNVILVVPMGREGFRVQDDPSEHSSNPLIVASRAIAISSPSASISIAAPNGAVVGTLSIAGAANEITLKKSIEVRASLGTVTLSMNPSNLIFGSSFRTSRNTCSCVPTIDGARPRTWNYLVYAYFDGATLKAEIRQLSVSFRNANFAVPLHSLGAAEELVMTAPVGGLVLQTTSSVPQSSAALEGSFLLREF